MKAVFQVSYSYDSEFSDRQIWANSADPDQTAPRGAVLLLEEQSDQGLHCLVFCVQLWGPLLHGRISEFEYLKI